jgi:hypothetical protein
MHSANFTPFSRLEALLPPLPVLLALPVLLPVPVPVLLLVWAGVLEPHPLIRATMAIRANAASGRSVLFMRSPAGGHLR